jgi:diguanylate cyclase (GGDEF)-like protein/PAS domain S-box-containing protein
VPGLDPDPDTELARLRAELGRLRAELGTATAAVCKAYEDNARMVRVLAVLGQPGTPEELSGRALTILSQTFHADVTCLARQVGDRLIVTSDCGLAPGDPAYSAGWVLGPGAAEALSGSGPVARAADGLEASDVPPELSVLSIRSAAWVPLCDGASGELLILYRRNLARFTAAELQVLASVAFRLSVAIATRQRGIQAERLSRSGHRLSQHLNLSTLFGEACTLLRELGLAESAAVFEIDGEHATLRSHCGDDRPTRFGERGPAADLPGWSVVAAGQPYRATTPWFAPHTSRSVVCVPVTRDDAPNALLYAVRGVNRPFAEGEVETATTVAYYLRSAMMNAELYHALRDSEATLRLITDSISDLVVVVDGAGTIRYASPSHQRELHHLPNTLNNLKLTKFVHPADTDTLRAALADPASAPKVEYRMRTGSGAWVWVETVLRPASSKDPSVVLSSRVIEERRRLEAELRQRATHDPLTGLANRALAGQFLEDALANSVPDRCVGLLFCDLDRFKEVNDRLGHDVGDELLKLVATRLRGCVRKSDLLARIGGDEFIFLLNGIDDLSGVTEFGRRVTATLEAPFTLRGESVPVSASVGGVLGRPGHSNAQAMMRNADAAMYAAKRRGPGLVEVFDEDASHRSLDRLRVCSDLRFALDRDELAVYYQPIFNLITGEILRFEALVRWHHPERGLIGPDVFISLAEETGIIVPIGSWVLDQAVRQLHECQRLPGRRGLSVSVNLSAVQLQRPSLAGELTTIMDQAEVDRGDVWLEVTEHSAVSTDAAKVLDQLNDAGAHICLDDFGVSHSNLEHLARLPVDCIKIDRQFVAGLTGGPRHRQVNRGIVRAVLVIADSMGLGVVAEGVETDEQRLALLRLGCERAQGFLLSRPLPAEGATALL